MSRTRVNKLKSLVYVCSSATCIFSGLCLYQENENFYENVVIPITHSIEPELSHKLAVTINKYNILPKSPYKDPSILSTKLWNLEFKNPIGIAAGFDKDGQAVQGLHNIGFGFVEIGSVTPEPQPGNEKPRVFRLHNNKAIINRYGFNSEGHKKVIKRLEKLREQKFQGVVGVNLGKNKESDDPIGDYVKGVRLFGPLADYLVINVSSPNTPGLRDWQKKEKLEELLTAVVAARDSLGHIKPPLLLKLSPDLSEIERSEIAKLILKEKCQIDGLVISNATIKRNGDLQGKHVTERGGLSGMPLAEASTNMIAEMFKLTKGQIPIIGVGGIFDGEDAYRKIKAGASLIQMYTAFVYHGPPRITRIKKELDKKLTDDGFVNISEAVGKSNKS
ncbi:dihydroorotate dehydrogenase 2 [Rhodnius prolixus]